MQLDRIALLGLFVVCFHASPSNATEINQRRQSYPFYLGVTGGYGATTWSGLVPQKPEFNEIMSVATPIRVKEGGAVYGVFAGCELNEHFALEAAYTHYPDATVHFDEMSLFAFSHDGSTILITHTETASFTGKFIIPISHTSLSAYSSAGAGVVHRDDIITNRWRVTPTFNVGLIFPLSSRVLGEFSVNYTSGYGESELNPSLDYIPFLYSAFFSVAYRL